jgi:hypothetical protein
MSKEIIPIERVVQSIRWIRGQKVFDSDLAASIRRDHWESEQSGQPESRPIPIRFHVPT